MIPRKTHRDGHALAFVCQRVVLTILALGWTGAARADEPLDGRGLVNSYRDIVELYRRHDAADYAQRQALVLQAARWDLDLARLAATLAAMPPPDADILVRLGSGEGTTSEEASASPRTGRRAAMATSDPSGGDALEYARADSQSRLAANDLNGGGATPRRNRDHAPLLAGVAAIPPSLSNGEEGTTGAEAAQPPLPQGGSQPAGLRGGCLIARFATDCADALEAAALLHTDVATLELGRGRHERAASHRAIAGWLLWHLPQRVEKAESETFAKDWLLAVSLLLRSDGSLSSARQLGQLGLARFPKDDALLLATATASQALTTLCYEADGTPIGGEDCLETPVAFDTSQPERPSLRQGQRLDQGRVLREAERLLRTLASQRPADPEVHLRFGHVLLRRGQAQEARRELRWVIDNASDTDQVALARLLLGRLAEVGRDVQGALEQARAARLAAPDSQSVRLALANALLAHGDRTGAVEALAGLPNTPAQAADLWAQFLLGSRARFIPARGALFSKVRLP